MTDITSVTVDIVSAYVSKNNIPADEMANLLKNVHEIMSGLIEGTPSVLQDAKPVPAVSIKKSVHDDAIVCLSCGKKLKTLKRHVMASHGQTPAEYKAYWSLPENYPTTAPAYAKTRSALATKIGLGRKARTNGGRNKAELASTSKRVKATSQPKVRAARKKAA